MLSGAEIMTENVLISLKELQLEDNGSSFIWLGKHVSDQMVERPGKSCHSIQSEVEIQ